jgi:hypothetical protein
LKYVLIVSKETPVYESVFSDMPRTTWICQKERKYLDEEKTASKGCFGLSRKKVMRLQ